VTVPGGVPWPAATGALRADGGRATLYLHEGRPYCADRVGGPSLEDELARRGEVDRGRWQDAARRAPTAVGEELVRSGTTSRRVLRDILHGRVVGAALELVQAAGRASMEEGDRHPVGPVVSFALDKVLAEARQCRDDLAAVIRTVPSPDAIARLARTLGLGQPEVRLGRDEWEVVAALGAGRSVRDIARILGRSELTAARLLGPLVETGLVVLHESPLPPT